MKPSWHEMQIVLIEAGHDIGYTSESFCFSCAEDKKPIPGKSPDCLYCLYAEEFPNGTADYPAHGFDYQAGKIVGVPKGTHGNP